MNTRRYPRTLVEAFGPYARWETPRRSFWHRHAAAIALLLFCLVEVAALAVMVIR